MADHATEIAALDKRGRRVKALAGWIAFGGLLLVPAMLDTYPFDHLTRPGFGPMIHVPALIAPALRDAGFKVQDAAGWALATDDDQGGFYALFMLETICVVAIVVALLRRQWALAVVALALWFTPSAPFFHKLTPGEELMAPVAPLIDHPKDDQPIGGPNPIVTHDMPRVDERFHRIGEPATAAPPVRAIAAPPAPPVTRIRLSLDSVPPNERPDIAYVLAQAAFKDGDPDRVASFYAALGRDYPQTDRITRDRIRILADYLNAHNRLAYEPQPASRWTFEIRQTENGGFALLVRAALLAALLVEVTGLLIRRRAKRVGGRLTKHPLMATA